MKLLRIMPVVAALALSGCGGTGVDERVDQNGPGPLPTPTLQLVSVSSNEVELAWQPVSGADEYVVERRDPGEDFEEVIRTSLTSLIDAGVVPQTSYRYRMFATGAGRAPSPLSALLVVDTPAPPPLPDPENLRATAVSATEVTLEWDAVEGADFYRAFRDPTDGGETVEVGTPVETTLTDTTVEAATSYTYTVLSFRNDGSHSTPGALVTVTTPGG